MQYKKFYCRLLCAVAFLGYVGPGVTEDVPYNGEDKPRFAKPGEVWCLTTLAPQFKTVTEEVMCEPASCRYEVIPAEFGTRTEQVLCKKESKRCIEIPAVYETRTEQVMCKKPSKRCIEIPAVYEMQTEQVMCRKESKRCIDVPAEYRTETEQVLECPERTQWQQVDCEVALNPEEQKGVCYGLVTIPARYVTRNKVVCVRPSSKTYEIIPAEYKTVEKRVCVKPSSKTYEIIPAEYKTVEKRICVRPESKRRIEIPARYETRTREVCVSPGRKVWRLTACAAPVAKSGSCDPCGNSVVARYNELPGSELNGLLRWKK